MGNPDRRSPVGADPDRLRGLYPNGGQHPEPSGWLGRFGCGSDRQGQWQRTQTIEVEGGEGLLLDSDVVLSVGSGTYKIELLGENDEVTLTLEAQGGQAASGHGQMVVDSLGNARYRVTATEAQEVEYSIDYVFR